MSFDRLDPAVQHHVVNSLGWGSLRPLQDQAIDPILDGSDVLIVGETAGGKTEAAVLPLLSRMAFESWPGLSCLYVSPLRALANNIELRLHSLLGLVGRTTGAWHGDIGPSARRAIQREPPDILVTTPESIEVMLVSTKVDHRRLFTDLRAIVVDEIHSFGSDDRGWHLLSILARIEHATGRRLQRIGLSATAGNPDELLEWLSIGPAPGDEAPMPVVVQSTSSTREAAEIRVDHVGALNNVSTVLGGLHRGEKRLVFCDSRAGVERVAAGLRQLKVETYVSHSSLGRDERRRAEQAFSEGSNCVIVATSTLELGIDVGDLDRVIQVDAPGSVASFLQRMGRTGRRPGTTSNTLFITTKSEMLVRALALNLLRERGFVEDINPPPRPLHIVAQQLMGLCLQERAVPVAGWFDHIAAAGLCSSKEAHTITSYMLEQGMVERDGELLFIGSRAEEHFGRKHFMELVSVFTSPPLIEVRHGRHVLGSVDESTFYTRDEAQPVLGLAGRYWGVESIDWKRRLAYVTPAAEAGSSRWWGSGQPLSFELARAMREVLCGANSGAILSHRATEAIAEARSEFEWLSLDATTIVTERNRNRWWTFAGDRANNELLWRLDDLAASGSGADELSVPTVDHVSGVELRQQLASAPSAPQPVAPDALDGLKFSQCLDPVTAASILRARAQDPAAVEACKSGSVNVHHELRRGHG